MKEIAREAARGDKHGLTKSAGRNAQIISLSWTNALLICAVWSADFFKRSFESNLTQNFWEVWPCKAMAPWCHCMVTCCQITWYDPRKPLSAPGQTWVKSVLRGSFSRGPARAQREAPCRYRFLHAHKARDSTMAAAGSFIRNKVESMSHSGLLALVFTFSIECKFYDVSIVHV